MLEELINKLVQIKNNRFIKDVTLGNLQRNYKWYCEHGYDEETALDMTIRFMFEHAWS